MTTYTIYRPNALSGAAAPPSAVQQTRREHAFTFTGSGTEYFYIWLVNITLSIITLGIYSAWAKVRREKYFHSHTVVAGNSFDYHARPVAILKGRILVLAIFLIFTLVNAVLPVVGTIMLLALVLVAPWFITTALKFRARYTSYRNLNFSFAGTTWQTFKYFVLWRVLGFVTFGLLIPSAKLRERRYVARAVRYGGKSVECDPRLRDFWKAYACLVFTVVLPLALAVSVFTARALSSAIIERSRPEYVQEFRAAESSEEEAQIREATNQILQLVTGSTGALLLVCFGLLAVVAPIIGVQFFRPLIARATWNAAALGPFRFQYTISAPRFAWIVISNFILRVVTIGFASPFCAVRLHRYRVDHLKLVGPADLSGFVAQANEDLRALGDQAAELYDLGIDLGF